MKVGILRCMQTEDMCPGTKDFIYVRDKKGVFAEMEGDIELVGFTNCGGCPGKRSVMKAKLLAARGAEAICLASCICKGTPIGYPCPFHAKMLKLLEENLPGIKIYDYTH